VIKGARLSSGCGCQVVLNFLISLEMIWLFLDFDGVLHPGLCDPADYLCCLPFLEDVLRTHNSVQIVVSSSWRHSYTVKVLRQLFSPDLRHRVAGTTPPSQPGTSFARFTEIRAWLSMNARPNDQWLALDDSAFEFPRGCPNLLRCNGKSGLTPDLATDLDARLRALMDQTSI